MLHPAQFGEHEWGVFTGATLLGPGSVAGAPVPTWAAAENAPAFQMLAMALPPLLAKVDMSNRDWERYVNSCYIYVYLFIYMCMYVCMCIYTHAPRVDPIYMFVSLCMYISIYLSTHTCIKG